MSSGKKLIDYTCSEAIVAVPTSVAGEMVREIAQDAFDNTTVKTAIIDTYANDINVSQITDVHIIHKTLQFKLRRLYGKQ